MLSYWEKNSFLFSLCQLMHTIRVQHSLVKELCGRKAKNKKAQERRESEEETVMMMKYWRRFSWEVEEEVTQQFIVSYNFKKNPCFCCTGKDVNQATFIQSLRKIHYHVWITPIKLLLNYLRHLHRNRGWRKSLQNGWFNLQCFTARHPNTLGTVNLRSVWRQEKDANRRKGEKRWRQIKEQKDRERGIMYVSNVQDGCSQQTLWADLCMSWHLEWRSEPVRLFDTRT